MSSSVHPEAGRALPRLTAQERAALTAVAIGHTQVNAAERLRVSPSVLKTALRAAVLRLGAESPTHAVVLAVLDGQLDPADVRGRHVPAWPGDRGRAATLARFERARMERAAEAVARFARFRRLVDGGLSPAEAGARLELAKRTTQKYTQRLERETTAREGANTVP